MQQVPQGSNTGVVPTPIVSLFPKVEWQSALSREVRRGNVPTRTWAVAMAFSSYTNKAGGGYAHVETLRLYVTNDKGQSVSEKTVDRALKWLKESGWIRPDEKRAHKGQAKEYWLSWPASKRDIQPLPKRDTQPLQSGTLNVPPTTVEQQTLSSEREIEEAEEVFPYRLTPNGDSPLEEEVHPLAASPTLGDVEDLPYPFAETSLPVATKADASKGRLHFICNDLVADNGVSVLRQSLPWDPYGAEMVEADADEPVERERQAATG